MPEEKNYDVAIIGAGVLGASLAYLLSISTDSRVALLEREMSAGEHTSSRNTGVIHRPFYLNPEKKAIFAWSAQKSFSMWERLAREHNLPWNPVGTLEIATAEEDTATIDQYQKWAFQNGMEEDEIAVFNGRDLENYENNVRGYGAILSRTDISVDFGVFTRKLVELAQRNGVDFLKYFNAASMDETGDGVGISGTVNGKPTVVRSSFAINAAGGDSLKLAHGLGLAEKYAVLHFRGDYWVVNDTYRTGIRHNIYTVPRHKKFPFLDPHFVIRHDGRKEVGPTATLVGSPYDYTDTPDQKSLALKILERPALPKMKLVTNPEFLSLVRTEWKSSRSRSAMSERVRRFIPSLDDSFLGDHGLSGVRNSLIDSNGFVPEAVIERGQNSYHVLNYNSPGATGAPAYSMHLLELASRDGFISLNSGGKNNGLWSDIIDS